MFIRATFYLSRCLLFAAVAAAFIVAIGDAFAQTSTSTLVTDGGIADVGSLLQSGKGWAAAGVILGLVARLARLVGLRNLFGPNGARIVSVVLTASLGIAAGMVEGSLVIALEAIVAGVMGILGGEAAARRTEARE